MWVGIRRHPLLLWVVSLLLICCLLWVHDAIRHLLLCQVSKQGSCAGGCGC
jgi:hypothetical protein